MTLHDPHTPLTGAFIVDLIAQLLLLAYRGDLDETGALLAAAEDRFGALVEQEDAAWRAALGDTPRH